MKKYLIALLIVSTLCFTGCSTCEVKKHEGIGTIKNTHTNFIGVIGKGGHRRYSTIIEYNGDAYRIDGSSTYNWAKEKIGEQVNLNIDEYWCNEKISHIRIHIDEYKN